MQHERESKNTCSNAMDGMIKRIEMGLYPARAPFGYKNTVREDRLSIFTFDGDKADYMKRAFEEFVRGVWSIPALKKMLDREFSHLDRTPTKKHLEGLLKSPFYYGDFLWDGVVYNGNPEYHPPLISYDLWKHVQAVFKRPGRSKRKVTQRNHPYLGLIKCGGRILDENGNETDQICGVAITCEEKRKTYKNGSQQIFHYYHCSNSSFHCSQKDRPFMTAQGRKISYTESEIETLMAKMLHPLHFDEEACQWMQGILLEEHRMKTQDHKQEVAALQRRHQMLHRYIDEAYEDKLKGNISESMWREKNDQWRSQLADVERQISARDNAKDEYIQNGVLLIELGVVA